MNTTYKTITSSSAREILSQQGFLIDVRSVDEYEANHLPSSINMPLEMVFDKYSDIVPNKQVPVIVYCNTGSRSRIAAYFLIDLGYKAVYDLGGIDNWFR